MCVVGLSIYNCVGAWKGEGLTAIHFVVVGILDDIIDALVVRVVFLNKLQRI